jgi:hypothetical protein
MGKTTGADKLKRRKPPDSGIFVIGGLHMDDFERASGQYEEISYVLVAYVLDCDGYHWKAIYVKADQIENEEGRPPTSLCLCASPRPRRQCHEPVQHVCKRR